VEVLIRFRIAISHKIPVQREGCRLDGWTNAESRLLLKRLMLPLTVHRKTPACIFGVSLLITEELFRMSGRTTFSIARALYAPHWKWAEAWLF
jgi:hypothetical protein